MLNLRNTIMKNKIVEKLKKENAFGLGSGMKMREELDGIFRVMIKKWYYVYK